MKITQVEPILYDAGLHRVWCFVRIRTDVGITGHEEPAQQRDLLETPLRMERGTMAIPAGPGLGIRLNEDVLERNRIAG